MSLLQSVAMVETVGTRLRKARLQRGWEVDQVAEMTKIRPERVLDMEADDYSEFPSLVYARSFLSKYAGLLGIDIRAELDNLRVSHSISLVDYQYLRSVPLKHAPASRPIEPRAFRVPPLLVAFLVLTVLVGLPVFAYLAIGLARLQPRFANELATPVEAVAGLSTPAVAQPSQAEALQSLVKDNPSPAAGIASATAPAGPQQPSLPATANAAGAVATAPGPAPAAAMSPGPASSPAAALAEQSPKPENSPDPGRPPAVAAGGPAATAPGPEASPAPGEGKRLEVRALRRTYIRVVRDKRSSQPVFSGYASPKAEPIVVEGKRFWLKVSDRRAVEVREDGQVVHVRSGNIVID
jgi:cytoskeleton protein RodZ